MQPTIEKISAVTLCVANMMKSVRFYRDVLGMELLYGGEEASFSSSRERLNLEQGDTVTRWGRIVFHVTNMDMLMSRPNEGGFDPEIPQDAS
jgi:catechol 2,3-dioxygenase-like lactoylglutathione lyase family enzyme